MVARQSAPQVRVHRPQVVEREIGRVGPALEQPVEATEVGHAEHQPALRRHEGHMAGEHVLKLGEVLDEPEREDEIVLARLEGEEVGVMDRALNAAGVEVRLGEGGALLRVLHTLDAHAVALAEMHEPLGRRAADLDHAVARAWRGPALEGRHQDPIEVQRRIRAQRRARPGPDVLLVPEARVDQSSGGHPRARVHG
jgi:hypothetical protein